MQRLPVDKQQVCPLVPLHDLLSDWCGASKAQLADVWVIGQTLSHHAACRGERDQGVGKQSAGVGLDGQNSAGQCKADLSLKTAHPAGVIGSICNRME